MPERRIELGSEARGEKPIAEQAPRRIENEHDELRFGDRIAVRSRRHRLREPADDRVDVLDVIYHRPVGVAETVVRVIAVGAALCVRDHLARVAPMLAVYLTQELREPLLAAAFRRARWLRRVARRVDEIVEARQLLETVLATELVEARHAALAIADQVERGNIEHA